MAEKTREPKWTIQRRLDGILSKLGEKYGDLTGRVEVHVRSEVNFEEIGGLEEAKAALRGFATALTSPDVYRRWGITPPKGVLLYGPPGTGKRLLAMALAESSEAIFYHLKLTNLTSKFGPNTGELLQEILAFAAEAGRAVVFLDEIDALSLEHLLPPNQTREASVRLVAALTEKLDMFRDVSRIMFVAATNRTDAVDPSLVVPGRLDRLIEVPFPDGVAQQQILELKRAGAEREAGRGLFAELDYSSILPRMGGMSGAEIEEIVRRTLESKVHRAAAGKDAGLVTTQDLLLEIDGYRRIRDVVEKIRRYGQYL